MKKNKFVSGATTGKKFEQLIDTWLFNAGIRFESDETISTGGRRRKGIKCDRKLIIGDKEVYVELKTTTENQALDFRMYDDGRSHKLKFHQISRMDWLIIEFRPHMPIAIKKEDFLNWWANLKRTKNSIGYKDALSIGKVITDMEWVKDDS